MKPIELAILITIIILIILLIYYDALYNYFKKIIQKNLNSIYGLLTIFDIIYHAIKLIRKFSISYILKSRLKNSYLFIPISILLAKIFINYNIQFQNNLPNWFHQIINFLIIPAVWELICYVTKIVDDQTR